eukprot:GFUD01056979.1.p1 GENE.GFUD01056979.1~~GFUD01056979.1.p1  ORF type:complete len:153 (+),score=49.75 GFUD01056979.1:15-473(+)
MNTILLLMFSVQLLSHCLGNLIDVAAKEGECEGSVTLYEGSEETVVTEDENVKVTVDKVKLVGCGCFSLHAKKGGRGRSYFLGRRGEYSGEDIGWSKVRSVRRVECESRAMPVWGVIVIVVGLVVVVAVGAVLGFRKYRQYRTVGTEADTLA